MKHKNKQIFNHIIEELKSNKDIVIATNDELNMTFFYQEQLCNANLFNKDYLNIIREYKGRPLDQVLVGICKEYKKKEATSFIGGIYQALFNGLLFCFDHQSAKFYLFDIAGGPKRGVSESNSEPEAIFASRDGFVENYKDNIALLRTRLRCGNMEIDEFSIGKRSETYVGLLSLTDVHNQELRQEIIDKISKIDIDALLEIEDFTAIFQDKKFTPTYGYVGSPDLAVRNLLDGQFLVVIDRIPTVVVLPINVSSYTRLRIDGVNIRGYSLLQKLFVLLSFCIAVFALPILTSFLTFQNDCLSLIILSTFKLSEKGVIFPVFVEIFFVLFLFELYYLIGFRSSKVTISSTIVLIAGLIIGQNTIASGISGVIVMTITALSFLASFAISSHINFVLSISIARYILLLSSLYYGIFGVTLGLCGILSIMYQETTLGVNFFYPFLPFDFKEFYRYFLPNTSLKNILRPNTYNVTDKTMKGDK